MKKLLTIICILAVSLTTKAQMIAVNTDVVTDALQAPNLGFEMIVSNKSSISLNALYANKAMGKDIKLVAIQPEYRHYISNRPMHGIFLGFGAIGSRYDISWSGKRYEGDAFGGGLTFGYVWDVTNRFCVDFHAGFGAVAYRQKEYKLNSNYDDSMENGIIKTNASGYYLIPTRIGISASYIIK